MKVIDELKLNVFRQVDIPSGTEYAQRYGLNPAKGLPSSGEEEAPMPSSKIDQLNSMAELNEKQLRSEARKARSEAAKKAAEDAKKAAENAKKAAENAKKEESKTEEPKD